MLRDAARPLTICLLIASPSIGHADDGTGNEPCELDPSSLPECPVGDDALLPDMMTVVPKHMSIQNNQQGEWLRFSNGLANVGDGPWWLEPELPGADATVSCQGAYQVITGPEHFPDRQLLADGLTIPSPADTYQARCKKGSFDFHESHNHWHIDNVGEFKLCAADDFETEGAGCEAALTSAGVPTRGIKFTFCLIDWYKLADNTANSDDTRNFFDCASGHQGITPGWVDQYHQSTDGQEIEITGLPGGAYVLVSTVNVGAQDGAPIYEESDVTNNTSYVRFDLDRSSKGNPKILNEVGACEDADHLAAVEASVAGFVARYEGGDAGFAAEMVEDICGGKPANR